MTMITEEQFATLIKRMEGKTLDFKRDSYDMSDNGKKLGLVKDVLSMANTPREDMSYIILGIKKYADGRTELVGVKDHVDDADLQSQFVERVHPIPEFTYEAVYFEGKSFGVIVIPPPQTGPSVPLRNYEKILQRNQVYFRRGSRNDTASPEESSRIREWIAGTSETIVETEPVSEYWPVFVDSVQGFESSSKFVLITDIPEHQLNINSEMLGAVDWTFVIDLDPYSDQEGVFRTIRSRLESRKSIHRVVKGDRPTLNISRGTYWFFARGLAGSDESVESGTWRNWRQTYGNEVREQITNLAKAALPTPAKVVALWYSEGMADYLQSILEDILAAFGSAVDFVIATPNASEPHLEAVADRTGSTLVQMPLHHICSGLKALFLQ